MAQSGSAPFSDESEWQETFVIKEVSTVTLLLQQNFQSGRLFLSISKIDESIISSSKYIYESPLSFITDTASLAESVPCKRKNKVTSKFTAKWISFLREASPF